MLVLEIRNRPMEHYLLSIFSLLSQGENKIHLKSCGSINGKTLDIINMLNKVILPHKFDVKIKHTIEKVKIAEEKNAEEYQASCLLATLTLK